MNFHQRLQWHLHLRGLHLAPRQPPPGRPSRHRHTGHRHTGRPAGMAALPRCWWSTAAWNRGKSARDAKAHKGDVHVGRTAAGVFSYSDLQQVVQRDDVLTKCLEQLIMSKACRIHRLKVLSHRHSTLLQLSMRFTLSLVKERPSRKPQKNISMALLELHLECPE